MGTWSAGLFGDDFTCDIKDEYYDLLREGHTPEDAVKLAWKTCQVDDEYAHLFWMSIADIQWGLGHMSKDVYEKAVEALESGRDEAAWADMPPKDQTARRLTREKLKKKLATPQPEPKAVKPFKGQTCKYKVGDVLSIHFRELFTKKNPQLEQYIGKYATVKVIAHMEEPMSNRKNAPMDQFPVVVAYDWIGDIPPTMELVAHRPILDLRIADPDVFGPTQPIVAVEKYGEKKLEVKRIGHIDINPEIETPKSTITWHHLSFLVAKTHHALHEKNAKIASRAKDEQGR